MTGVTDRGRSLLHQQRLPVAAIALIFLALIVILARPAGAENGSLLVSPNADRSAAVPLDGATISGPAYVFLTTGEAVQRVVFAIDGVDTQVENHFPYDLLGGSLEAATPWSTGSTADGSHSISAQVSLVGGGGFLVAATFTVDNTPDAAPTPAPSAGGSLLVSQSANRGGAGPLAGASLSGRVYPFLDPGTTVNRVEFSLNGQTHQIEGQPPYDFAGGSASAANPWDTASLADGSHTISALVVPTSGSPFTLTAAFTVANGTSGSTATPTPVAQAPSGTLVVSGSANRSGSTALGAGPLSGDAFIALTSAAQLAEVRFSLDGTFVRTEKAIPFDFGSTAPNGSARRWDTTTVTDGSHTIEATVRTVAGATFTVSALFLVDNDSSGDGTSEVQTTSEGSSGARTVEVFVSTSAGRGDAQILGADSVTGVIHVFAVPSASPDRIRFYIDPDDQPLPARTEAASPYDLGGSLPDGTSGPFDTSDLSEGVHQLLVVAEFADGRTATKDVAFTVEHPAVLPDTSYELRVSGSANRSAADPLEDAVLEDASFVFVSPADHIQEASFFLDDPARSATYRVDTAAPFDLVGGTASTAQPLDIDDLSPGSHSITVVLTRTNGTTSEAHATFTVGGSVAPAGAILIRTSDNAAQVASQHGPGATFFFEAGTHRGVSITPQGGDVFLGAPGAILSGAKVLTGWSPTSGFWSVGGQTSQLPGGATTTDGCMQYESGGWYNACQYPEQLLVDGEQWWQVTSIGRLGHGKWYFDYAADRVYIGGNPAGHVVELSTVAQAFTGSANNVTISGLVVEKYANRAQTGAIHAASGDRWTISNNEVRLNHGTGIRVGHRSQVLNNNVHRNGQLGIGGVGQSILIQGNEIAYNNNAGFLPQWEGGGTKFAVTNHLVVRDNWVHHNEGRGLWTDIDNINLLMVGNLVEYNSWSGIAHEIGYTAEFRENISRYNGHGFSEWEWGAQIIIQNSSDVLVIDNDVTVAASGGGNGITVVEQPRGSGAHGPHISDRVTVTGNTIRNMGVGGVSGSNVGCYRDITFDNNTYIAGPGWFMYRQIHWCSAKLFSEFQDAGQEANGTAMLR